MKTVVITGSTRGLGRGLAAAFLDQGCQVTISGRSQGTVNQVMDSLAETYSPENIHGFACDVVVYDQVQALWHSAVDRFDGVHIWINNAGIAHPQLGFWEHEPEALQALINTNLLGAMYGAKIALPEMLKQGYGALYNMEGLGSDGRKVSGLALYGTTKYALHYLTDALAAEMKDTPILVGALSPGMVLTDLLTQQYEDRPDDWEAAKRIFNVLADHVETVAPWLAEQVLANEKNGVHIKWLTRSKIAGRFLAAPVRKRNLFEDE